MRRTFTSADFDAAFPQRSFTRAARSKLIRIGNRRNFSFGARLRLLTRIVQVAAHSCNADGRLLIGVKDVARGRGYVIGWA